MIVVERKAMMICCVMTEDVPGESIEDWNMNNSYGRLRILGQIEYIILM